MAWFEDFAASSARAAEDAAAGVTDALLDVAEDLKEAAYDFGDETRDTWTDGVDEVRLGIIGGGHLGGCLAFLGATASVLAGTAGHFLALACDLLGTAAGGAVDV